MMVVRGEGVVLKVFLKALEDAFFFGGVEGGSGLPRLVTIVLCVDTGFTMVLK